MTWIQPQSGAKFDPLNPKAEDIHIEDIAHALSNLCRFNGHTKYFYSVAQHSVLGTWEILREVPEARWLALAFLLHDAAEALCIGDIPTPAKDYLPHMADIEDRILEAVHERFGLLHPTHLWNHVKHVDRRMLATERAVLLPPCEDWPALKGVELYDLKIIQPCAPERAKSTFMDLWRILKP